MSVLGLIISFHLYLRSAMVRFPLQPLIKSSSLPIRIWEYGSVFCILYFAVSIDKAREKCKFYNLSLLWWTENSIKTLELKICFAS